MKRKNTIIAGCIIAIISAGAWAFMTRTHDPVEPKTKKSQASMSVTVVRPKLLEVPNRVEAFGIVAPWQEFSVSGDISGYRIVSLSAEVGDRVRKGQTLARFNDELLRHEREQLAATLEQATIKAKLSEEEAARYSKLDETNSAAKQDVSAKKSQASMDKATVASLRAQLASTDAKLKYTNIIAPDDGIVSSRSVVAGSFPAQGTEMFRIIRQGRLEWRAEVPGKSIDSVEVGAKASISVGNRSFDGTVRKIAPNADEKNRTFVVFIDADMPSSATGTYAKGSIISGKHSGLFVPGSSIRTVDGRASVPVAVVGADGKATIRRTIVETGVRTADGMTEIKGIPVESLIVKEGSGFLNDGDIVIVKETAK